MNLKDPETSKSDKQLYRDGLEPVVKARYLEKLKLIGGTDPYELKIRSYSDDKKLLPSITYPDIVNYLLFSPSPYTSEDLKGLKSLDAYNQAQNGWVSDVRAIEINNRRLVRAKVLHSMRLRDKALNPWSVVDANGVIKASHCDCMAGLGEVCSHVAAMLFSIMEIVRIRDSQTVTQEPAYWKLPPSVKSVSYKEVKDIDFTSAKSLKRKLLDSQESSTVIAVKKKVVNPPTADQIRSFFNALNSTGVRSAILSVTEPFSDEFRPTIEKHKLPKLMHSFREKEALKLNYGQLLKSTEDFRLEITHEEIQNVEMLTRKQSKCKLWNDFRAGRITASKIKQAISTDPGNPSLSLIMSVCYPGQHHFSTAATNWGLKNENVAQKKFLQKLNDQESHENIEYSECGLFISGEYPFLAASPDGIIECDCCAPSILEIKCPYIHRDSKLSADFKDFFLIQDDDNKLMLDKKHQYYYQVQAQLGVSKYQFAYFVVYTEKDLHYEKIEFDPKLWDDMCEKASKIFSVAIVPEIVGKFFSRLPGTGNPVYSPALTEKDKSKENVPLKEKTWCYCDQVESGEMIACDNEKCPFLWFHFTCLKLNGPPKNKKWYCPDCRKRPQFKRNGKKKMICCDVSMHLSSKTDGIDI